MTHPPPPYPPPPHPPASSAGPSPIPSVVTYRCYRFVQRDRPGATRGQSIPLVIYVIFDDGVTSHLIGSTRATLGPSLDEPTARRAVARQVAWYVRLMTGVHPAESELVFPLPRGTLAASDHRANPLDDGWFTRLAQWTPHAPYVPHTRAVPSAEATPPTPTPTPRTRSRIEDDLLDSSWYAVPDDTVGGWAIANVDQPVSQINHVRGDYLVGEFLSERLARHVARLHNAELDRKLSDTERGGDGR